jgi:hypothetical protein
LNVGVEGILEEASHADLSNATTIKSALDGCFFLTAIEVLDRNDISGGCVDEIKNITLRHDVCNAFGKLISCPREIVKFFHRLVVSFDASVLSSLFLILHLLLFRRIPCDCLKNLY